MKLLGLHLVSLVASVACAASPPGTPTAGPSAVFPPLAGAEPLPSAPVVSKTYSGAMTESSPAAAPAHDERSGAGELPVGGDSSSDGAPAPRIYSTGYITWIVDRPRDDGRRLGFVRSGYGVALRSLEKLAATDRCRGGWYAVEPRGFVCKSQQATLDPEHPLVRATREAVPPQAGAFPLSYAFSLGAPMYNVVPSDETHRLVMMRFPEKRGDLGDWASNFEELASDAPIPANGPMPSFLAQGTQSATATRGPLRRVLPHGSMLSYGRAFEAAGRVWLVAADLSIVPADRVRAYRQSTFRGAELGAEIQLPLAWVKARARPKHERSADGRLLPVGESWDARAIVRLTGEELRQGGKLYLETAERGLWVRRDHLRIARAVKALPDGIGETDKWLYVSLRDMTLVAYRGMTPVYATLQAPGRGGVHEGKGNVKNYTTPLGGFHINWKERWGSLSPDRGEPQSFWISDVMWIQYFKQPYALHGAYWHEGFGDPKSAGCPNLAPLDALWLFGFTDPVLPDGWQGVAPAPGEKATVVVLGA
jgi:hypothetical protein